MNAADTNRPVIDLDAIACIPIYKVTPVSENLVCLDLPGTPGPMVDRREFAAILPLAKKFARHYRALWKANGDLDGDLKEYRYHLAQRTLTPARETRINAKMKRNEKKAFTANVAVFTLASQIEEILFGSKTLAPLNTARYARPVR